MQCPPCLWKSARLRHQISQNQNLPFIADQHQRCSHRTRRQLSGCLHRITLLLWFPFGNYPTLLCILCADILQKYNSIRTDGCQHHSRGGYKMRRSYVNEPLFAFKTTKHFSFEISCLHILCYKRIIDFKMVSKKKKNLVFESEGAYENNNENRVSKQDHRVESNSGH